MIRGAIVLAAVLAIAATGASAKDDGQAQTEEATKEKKVCKTEKMTGSLTRRRRICMTEAQWRELNARTRKGLDEMGQSGAGGTRSQWDPSNAPPGG